MSPLEIAICSPFFLYAIFLPASMVQGRRRRAAEKEEWDAFATGAVARGWRWETRPGLSTYPAGLRPTTVAMVRWRITGARGESPWIVEQTFSRDGGPPGRRSWTNFRGLLASPAPYGLHVGSTALLRAMASAPAMVRESLVDRSRDRRAQTELSPEDVAAIMVGDAAKRCAVPAELERAGYSAAAAGRGASRTSAILELIAPAFAEWRAMYPDCALDLMVLGGVVELDASVVLHDFDAVERLVALGAAVLDAVERA